MVIRRYDRVDFFCPVELTTLSAGVTFAAQTFDISVGGVGVLSQGNLEQGDLVTVSFHMQDGSQRDVVERIEGKVTFFRADEGCNRYGVEFLKPVHESKQPALMHRLLKQ